MIRDSAEHDASKIDLWKMCLIVYEEPLEKSLNAINFWLRE